MALTRTTKEEMIERYEGSIGQSANAFLVDFKGVSVNEATDLRSRIREVGGSYEVVKNTLAKRAVAGKALGHLGDQFSGPTAVAWAEDPVALAKALTGFAKDFPQIQFKGGVVDGTPVSADQVEDIARMPGREELLAKLLFLLQSPITRLARGMAAISRDFVVVLDQIAKKKAEQG